jgi:nitrite reductase/ring-hydroxylating ferredoxin subunit
LNPERRAFDVKPMNPPSFESAIPLSELRAGRMTSCVLGGREVLICHTAAGLFAVDNVCTHADARLSEGRLRGTRVVCPLHGASFDVRDGRVLGAPAERALAVHELRIVDGIIEVAL